MPSTKRTKYQDPFAPSPCNVLTFTLSGAARATGLSPSTLRRRAKEGLLQLIKVGHRTLIVGDSLRRLVNSGTGES